MRFTMKTALMAFSLLIGISFVLISSTNRLILTPDFYKNSGDVLGYDENALSAYVNVQKYIYGSEIIYLFIKVLLIALVLYTTLYLVNKPVKFVEIFSIVTLAEFVFVIAAFGKLLWFHFQNPSGTLEDWHKTYLLSVLSIIPDVKPAWYYPLQTLNAFEVAYWFLLAYGISKITQLDFDGALQIVIKGYVPTLIVWVACVVFVTLVFFPTQA